MVGQHDHGGERAPILSSTGYLWPSIREFHPKVARAHGPSHTPTSLTGGSHQTGEHIIPSECPRWCRDGGSLPGRDPCYFLPYNQNPRAQQWHPSLRHCPSPGGGQQGGPWRPASDQILDWHPQAEASFQFQYDSLAKRVQNTWDHQGSKGSMDCSIKEADACCLLAIWEMESWGDAQACSIQQSHAEDIQHLEEESLEEERRGQLNFLSTCQATLDASPPEYCGTLIALYHLLLGCVPIFNLFTIPPGPSPPWQGSIPGVPSPSAPLHLGLCPDPSGGITHQTWQVPHPLQDHIQGDSQGDPLSEVAGGDASSQGIDEKLSRGIQPRLPFSKKGQGGILQEPSPGLW